MISMLAVNAGSNWEKQSHTLESVSRFQVKPRAGSQSRDAHYEKLAVVWRYPVPRM